ncbi:MAG: hypothetical protein ACJAZO_004569 [Myxococcota bacterium]|jgi:hypothetical protein
MRRSLLLSALFLAPTAIAAPLQFPQQGRLLDGSGAPINGSHTLTFGLYTAPTGSSPTWTESDALTLEDGFYGTVLGDSTPLTATLLAPSALYLGVTVDGIGELGPRTRLMTVPYAAVASAVAPGTLAVDGLTVGGTTVVNSSGNIDAARIVNEPQQLGALPSCSVGDVAAYSASGWICARPKGTNYAITRNFVDVRNASTAWTNVSGRTVTLVVEQPGADVHVTYQDSIGFHMTGTHAMSCRWRMLMDGNQVGQLQWHHSDTGTGWRIWGGSEDWLISGVASGSHTFQLQVILATGASGCLNGWSDGNQENFMLAREL